MTAVTAITASRHNSGDRESLLLVLGLVGGPGAAGSRARVALGHRIVAIAGAGAFGHCKKNWRVTALVWDLAE